MSALNLHNLLSRFTDHYSFKIITSLNEYDIKLVKLLGEFVWHTHDDTDELFLVLAGRLTIQLRDRDVVLNEGELFVVGKGVEHCPKAEQEVSVLLIEPKGVRNTGSEGGERTVEAQMLG